MKDKYETTVYFQKPGPENTEVTLQKALERARELKIKDIIVATTNGQTGLKAAKHFGAKNLIVVTHSTGFSKPEENEISQENLEAIKKHGAKVLTSIHAFGGIGRAIRKKFGTYELDDIIAGVLRIFGEGTKVCIEIALMAADAGLVGVEEEVIAIAGTGHGADTALIIKPANVQRFFELRVKEVICKPRF